MCVGRRGWGLALLATTLEALTRPQLVGVIICIEILRRPRGRAGKASAARDRARWHVRRRLQCSIDGSDRPTGPRQRSQIRKPLATARRIGRPSGHRQFTGLRPCTRGKRLCRAVHSDAQGEPALGPHPRDRRGPASGVAGVPRNLQHDVADPEAWVHHPCRVPSQAAFDERHRGVGCTPVSQKPQAVQLRAVRLTTPSTFSWRSVS
jgi:hypothetical protein